MAAHSVYPPLGWTGANLYVQTGVGNRRPSRTGGERVSGNPIVFWASNLRTFSDNQALTSTHRQIRLKARRRAQPMQIEST